MSRGDAATGKPFQSFLFWCHRPQQPHPGGQLRRHINHPLPGSDQLPGQQMPHPVGALHRPGPLRPARDLPHQCSWLRRSGCASRPKASSRLGHTRPGRSRRSARSVPGSSEPRHGWMCGREVTAGFAAASSKLEVPLAHTILRRSLVELHAGEYRLCVIDACAAAEIALGAALTVHLRAHGLTDAETEQLLRLGSGIAESFPVYRQLIAAGQSAVSGEPGHRPARQYPQSGRPCWRTPRRDRRTARDRDRWSPRSGGGPAAASGRHPAAGAIKVPPPSTSSCDGHPVGVLTEGAVRTALPAGGS